MIYALNLGALTLVATAIAGVPFVNFLRRLKLGKEVSAWGPERHMTKAGTPTMGGIIFLVAIAGSTLVANVFRDYDLALPLLVMAGMAALGFMDDLGSLQGRPQRALNKRVKLAAFILIGLVSAWALYWLIDMRSIGIPFAGFRDLSVVFLPIAVVIVVLTAGGVAVTDGLDGLAAGASAIAFGAYGGIALGQGQNELGAFCFTVAGAVLGFLWHNSHPATMFMGDTGALALGGGLAVVAFMTGHWLLLPLIGVVFVLEGASTYLQIAYFKLTGGKRIFRMAPLHHHFEQAGWGEVQVVQRFWLLQAVGAAAGVMLALEV